MKPSVLLVKLLCGTLCYKNITQRPTEKTQRNTEKSLHGTSRINLNTQEDDYLVNRPSSKIEKLIMMFP